MDFIKLFGLFTTASVIFVWLLKKVAVKWIDSTFTIKERELDHRLKMIEQKEGLVFDREHADQREAIKNVHAKLVIYTTELKSVVVGLDSADMLVQRLIKLQLLLPDLYNSIGFAELYVPESVSKKLGALEKSLNGFEIGMLEIPQMAKGNVPKHKTKEEFAVMVHTVLKEFADAANDLVAEFKKLTRTKVIREEDQSSGASSSIGPNSRLVLEVVSELPIRGRE